MRKEEVQTILEKELTNYKGKFGSIEYNELLRLFMGQIYAESSFNEFAVSPVGAQGLTQFMPATWEEWGKGDPFNPKNSIRAQLKYMKYLFDCYSEIPNDKERFKFALGAYNAGRGSINQMLAIAREKCGLPKNYSEWRRSGSKGGAWQLWSYASTFLVDVTGRHHKETLGYVNKILDYK